MMLGQIVDLSGTKTDRVRETATTRAHPESRSASPDRTDRRRSGGVKNANCQLSAKQVGAGAGALKKTAGIKRRSIVQDLKIQIVLIPKVSKNTSPKIMNVVKIEIVRAVIADISTRGAGTERPVRV